MIRGIRLLLFVTLCSLVLVGCNAENHDSNTQHNDKNESNENVSEISEDQVDTNTETEETGDIVTNTDTSENTADSESDIKDVESNAVAFENYKDLTYTIMENSSYVTIKRANYMPELRSVCVDVTITDPQYRNVTYIARLGSSSDANESYSMDKHFSVDYSGDSTNLCFNELTNGENYIHIIRSVSLNTWATVALTFHYNDEDYLNRSKLTNFYIHNKTESTVELGEDPNITIDFILNGDKEAIGKLLLKAFDTGTGDVVHEKEFSKDELIFDNNVGTISNYKIEGLTPGYKYHVAMLFYPPSDREEIIILDTADYQSSRISGLNSIGQFHNLYADIYGVEYKLDTTIFKTYINNSILDSSNNLLYNLNFNVYSKDGELLYSTPVADKQETVEIPNEYLFIGGYVTINIDSLDKLLSKVLL